MAGFGVPFDSDTSEEDEDITQEKISLKIVPPKMVVNNEIQSNVQQFIVRESFSGQEIPIEFLSNKELNQTKPNLLIQEKNEIQEEEEQEQEKEEQEEEEQQEEEQQEEEQQEEELEEEEVTESSSTTINHVSIVYREAEERIATNGWDVDAWISLITEAQLLHSGKNSLKDVYLCFLKQFPCAGSYWKYLAEYALQINDTETLNMVFSKALIQCVNLELWLFYINCVQNKKMLTIRDPLASVEAKQHARVEIVAAFEFSIQHFGISCLSGPIWSQYIEFVQSWPESTQYEKGPKIKILRKAFQRMIVLPLTNLRDMWDKYEEFEVSLNKQLAAEFFNEYKPLYQNALLIGKEKEELIKKIDFYRLASPPFSRTSLRQKQEEKDQYNLWIRFLQYELTNPENVGHEPFVARVRLTFHQFLCAFRFLPEVWQAFAEFEIQHGNFDAAILVYQSAIEAIPDSVLLLSGYCEVEEKFRGNLYKVKKLWRKFIKKYPSACAFSFYQQFIRRTEGRDIARNVFSLTKQLRKNGQISSQIFLSHAKMEFFVNKNAFSAQNICEAAIRQDPECINQNEFVLFYVDLLLFQHKYTDLRSFFQRYLIAPIQNDDSQDLIAEEKKISKFILDQKLSDILWKKYLEFEHIMSNVEGDFENLRKVEKQYFERQKKKKKLQSNDVSDQLESYSIFEGLTRLLARSQTFGVVPAKSDSGETNSDFWFLERSASNRNDDNKIEEISWKRSNQPSISLNEDGHDQIIGLQQKQNEPSFELDQGIESKDTRYFQKRLDIPNNIPSFCIKLFQMLPFLQDTRNTLNIDLLLTTLHERQLPTDVPTKMSAPEEDYSGNQAMNDKRRGKRKRDDDSDSNDENIMGIDFRVTNKQPEHDLFRSRQQTKLMQTGQF